MCRAPRSKGATRPGSFMRTTATVADLCYKLAVLATSRNNMRGCIESGFTAYASTIRRALGAELRAIYLPADRAEDSVAVSLSRT